ncbi:MAG: Na/Pi cotransporter family protein [Eubacterium sp.]|jgi:phosphate:Na+ symporter|nr:Na/Pi cotransporter family protein [Eubacterium sp.]
MDIFKILTLVGGLAMFLFGMQVMGNSLQTLSGSRLERILERMTSNIFKSVFVGVAVTGVIQSSSATTVMVVGLVNSGLMKLRQAIGIIMGANIGTTVTAWLISLAGIQSENIFLQLLKPSSFTPVLGIIGVFMIMLSKSSRRRETGMIILGFTVLMVGMDMMSGSVKDLATVPGFTEILIKFQNPIMGVLAGAVITAIFQSSSASIGVLQALCMTGSVTYGAAIPIIMGQNIGTCITAILSSIGANKNAKRAALVHLYFNIIGTIIFMAIYYLMSLLISLQFSEQAANPAGIAVVHSVFNIFATIILLPFAGGLEKLAYLTIRKDKGDVMREKPLIDESFLDRPSFAIKQALRAASDMGKLAYENLMHSLSLLTDFNESIIEQVEINEKRIDEYEDKLGSYLIKMEQKTLITHDNTTVNAILHCIGDFERIGDHAFNVSKTCLEMHKKELAFSYSAKKEIAVLTGAVKEIVKTTIDSFAEGNSEKAHQVEPLEEVIDKLHRRMKKRHIERLQKGVCTIEMGFVLSDLLDNYERIADHCSNIAAYLIQSGEDRFDTHEYLNELKRSENPQFLGYYKKFTEKYVLP